MSGIYFILFLYITLNFLILFRVSRYLKFPRWIMGSFISLFIVVALGYLIARILKGYIPQAYLDMISLAGSFWIVAFVYFFLFWLAFEAGHLLLLFTGKLESTKSKLPKAFPAMAVVSIVIFVVMVITAGYFNNRQIVIREMSIGIDKAVSENQNLRVVMVTDIHLGYIVDGKRAEQIIKVINDQKPDIVFLTGDIIDIDTKTVVANGGAAALDKIEAPLGVFACLGNREEYAGEDASFELLDSVGINVLRDEFINLANGLQIAGRLDVSRERFGKSRKPLKNIIGVADKNMPIILLDHQPKALKEAQDAGVDLILCGHTHNGQFWPFNYVVKMIFDVAYGYAKWGDMNIYVSNGVGTWGPPVRIGLPPEIVVINIHFTGKVLTGDKGLPLQSSGQ